MKEYKPDLLGELTLFRDSGKKWPINKEYWGHANIENEIRQDSYSIKLIDIEVLKLGEKCQANFKYKFSHLENFKLKIEVNETIILNEGFRIIGSFKVLEVLNKTLKK